MSIWTDVIASYAPLSWWRFRDASATVVDEGSAGNDGTIVSDVNPLQSPLHCGEAAGDDYAVEFPEVAPVEHAYMAADPALVGTPSAFTFLCVVRIDAFGGSGYDYLATNSKVDGGFVSGGVITGDGWNITVVENGGCEIEVVNPGGTDNWHVRAADVVPLHVPHMVGFTYDEAAGPQIVSIFDGCPTGERTTLGGPTTITYDPDREFRLGGQVKAFSQYQRAFIGIYDEAVLFDRVLTPSEMARIAAAGCFGCGEWWADDQVH